MSDGGDPYTAEPLPDDILLELGRLVWAAINLEDVTYPLCRSVQPRFGPFDDVFISRRIDQARKDLKRRPADDLRKLADAWLVEAKAALEERNGVMHSVPTVYLQADDLDRSPEVTGQWLTHFPRDRSRPVVRTPLTIEGLSRIRERLERARLGWNELASELWANRLGLY